MSEKTGIKWTDSTVNFWSGCTKVSPGCANCYAETLSKRFAAKQNWTMDDEAPSRSTLGKWGKGAPRKLHESAFKLAKKLNRKPHVCECENCGQVRDENNHPCMGCGIVPHRRRIFSLSLGDWLDPEVPVEWLARMLDTVRQCPDVDWILCTKRPELWRSRIAKVIDDRDRHGVTPWHEWLVDWHCGLSAPSNVVILTSVENQEQADKRIPELLRIPARRRGLSCEPLLGPVDLQNLRLPPNAATLTHKLDWVIIGGESGDKARPCDVAWIRSLRDQCNAAAVPCFIKQLGAFSIQEQGSQRRRNLWNDRKGGDWNEWPDDLKVREFYRE